MVSSNEFTQANILSGENILVTGDFNDYDDKFLDAKNNVPISSVLYTVKHNTAKAKVLTVLDGKTDQVSIPSPII